MPDQLGQLTNLTHLDVSQNELTGALSTRSERSVQSLQLKNCCCAGPPLEEVLQFLTPLSYLEVLNLGYTQLRGIITTVERFIRLKRLLLAGMQLEGKSLSTRTELHQTTR